MIPVRENSEVVIIYPDIWRFPKMWITPHYPLYIIGYLTKITQFGDSLIYGNPYMVSSGLRDPSSDAWYL